MRVTRRCGVRARHLPNGRAAHAAVAVLVSVGLGLVVVPQRADADAGTDAWVSPGRLDDGLTEARLDRCRLGFVAQAGGPAVRAVAQAGLTGTVAQMHTAADTRYWYGDPLQDTPLHAAQTQDVAMAGSKWDTLHDRKDVWSQSIPNNFDLPTTTVTDFQWAPDLYGNLGISGFYRHQSFSDEPQLYRDLAPIASDASLASATDLAKAQHLYVTDKATADDKKKADAWKAVGNYDTRGDGVESHGNRHADDIREFLQYGGWPTVAPTPGSAEYRFEVEAIKQRFAACDTANPLDPNQVLAPVVHTAAAEWQAELDSQATQRAAIVAAQIRAFTDLETAAIAMGEAVGQSWIAGQLAKWQAYWSPGGPGRDGSGPLTVKLKSATTMCLDNTGASTANGNKIEAYTCASGATKQQWQPSYLNIFDGPLVNVGAQKCMDINGTNVVLYTCTTNKQTQRWQYTTTAGQSRLYNVGTGKCLNFASTAAGTAATVQACTDGTPQQFLTTQNNAGTGTGTDSSSFPKPADFTYAVNEIKNTQARAAAQLTIANNAAADAQLQATAVTNAQTAAATIATTNNYPVGRGLAYAQQSAQVVKASAAGALAAAKATDTALQATKAAVADSATLVSLAQTQAAAMRAEYAKTAAQEAARQAHTAALAAAAEATAAAASAATAKAKRIVAEQAQATAQTAADKAAAQRKIAEQQRQVAADQRAIAEQKHAVASAANADAQRQQGIAAGARADAQADAQVAADHDLAAQTAANGAMIARETADNARKKKDSLAARAEALQAKADAAVGTSEAAAARQAANDAQAAADRAATAATAAQHDADVATDAAQDARAAATAAHAAAARAEAAADKADQQVAITRSAAATAHAAAADALAAARDAKQHANAADADAAVAAAAMHEAAIQSGLAKAAAAQAQTDSAVTAGRAYATSLAAVAARDSAVEVAAPANEAVGLGAPFAERDSSAALAVLVGQTALTVAQQQTAAADARVTEATKAATTAAALAASAVGDAKLAAQAAADAAADASAAAKSAKAARASAAAAAAEAALAAKADAATTQLNAQAERDAAAAHSAATAATSDADAADTEADAAERDAASARAAAVQAQKEADAAQDAADLADHYADDAEAAAARARADAAAAEAAATQAEQEARVQDQTSQIQATWDGGYAFLQLVPDLTVDTWNGTCTTSSGSHTCDIDVPLHMHGTTYYNLVVCQLNGTTSATCSQQPLGTAPIDLTVHRTLHMDTRVALKAVWDNLVHLAVGDFISCGKAISAGTVNTGCAWAAAQLIPYGRIAEWLKVILLADDALRTGVGISKALELMKASDLPVEVLPRLSAEAGNITRLVTCVANAASVAKVASVAKAAVVPEEVCQVDLLSAGGKTSYQSLKAAVLRARDRSAADYRNALSDSQVNAGKQEPWLRRMYLGSILENFVSVDTAVKADARIAHLGTAAPGQAVADFVITDGTLRVNIDVTGASATSIKNHLGRSYITGKDQILDYETFSDDFINQVFQ